jgi:hypothetical protein
VAWDICAILVVIALGGLLVWDKALRGVSRGARVIAAAGVVVFGAGAWMLADENVFGWVVGLAGALIVAAARRAGPAVGG